MNHVTKPLSAAPSAEPLLTTGGEHTSPTWVRFMPPKFHPLLLTASAFLAGLIIASNVGCATHQPNGGLLGSNSLQNDHLQNVSLVGEQAATPVIRQLAAGENLSDTINQASGRIILDFYADWCGPCKRQSSELHALEGQLAQSGTTVIKVNTDHHPALKSEYGISGLPTLVLIENGNIANRSVGLTSSTKLQRWLR